MKFRNLMKNYGARAAMLTIMGGALLSPAWATSGTTDPYSGLVTAVNFTSVITDVISVGALVVAVLVAIRAVRFIYSIVRR